MLAKRVLLAASAFIMISFSASIHAGERWPDLPVPVKNGAGAKIGNTLYVGLGSAGKAWYSLDLATPGAQWTMLAEFPDAPRDAATTAAVNGQIYVFAGAGKLDPSDKTVLMFDTGYKYDPAANSWSKLPTRTPLGALASAAVSFDQQNILFFGGVNKQVFDGFFIDNAAAGDDEDKQAAVASAYFDQRPQDYFFTSQVMSYNVANNQWAQLGIDPNWPIVGAGVAVKAKELVLVGGEVKPGLRSPMAKFVTVSGNKLSWKTSTLTPAPGDQAQEGVAGAFAGYSGKALLVAGGTNFPGAWKQFNAGQNWAHKGLKKTWRDEIYAELNGQWQVAGKLPMALGYGNYFQLDQGLLIVGGELQDGAPSKAVFELRWNGKSVDIIR
ncbi:N-acetylneuraminate epimerase [Roseateles oligotrophus]|uniref:N-acetylneuraminate epimerase n=1 Tax=Roseateles oligotrophus TaxID=1769250 RepID=A0ABT2YKA5_9BURK|nr:N-acetylneuraminate epimerase [Roseateles oligotrophus]MCV2370396.1 N-acetylneuraminate epimerase [Roseateles oligotrophus]